MRLKPSGNYLDFMEAVKQCAGEVYFNSAEGDHLNLKSTFCRYLFASVCGDKEFLSQGEIICRNVRDYQLLGAYLTG